jgi:hypothetical protein
MVRTRYRIVIGPDAWSEIRDNPDDVQPPLSAAYMT